MAPRDRSTHGNPKKCTFEITCGTILANASKSCHRCLAPYMTREKANLFWGEIRKLLMHVLGVQNIPLTLEVLEGAYASGSTEFRVHIVPEPRGEPAEPENERAEPDQPATNAILNLTAMEAAGLQAGDIALLTSITNFFVMNANLNITAR